MLNLAYVAGFFDGEGSILLRSQSGAKWPYWQPRWQLVQSGDRGKRILEEIQDFLTITFGFSKLHIGKSEQKTIYLNIHYALNAEKM